MTFVEDNAEKTQTELVEKKEIRSHPVDQIGKR
jgi:hypothetical protein